MPGLFLLSALDSSFLFLPIGNDFLLAVLVAGNHERFVACILAASLGSLAGVALLDLVSRESGEKGLERIMNPRRLKYMKQKIEQRAAGAIAVACLAPPPFPFTAVIAAASAFRYSRARLFGIVFAARAVRFALIGWAAVRFGDGILQIASSPQFTWVMAGFAVLYVIGSILSLFRWFRKSKSAAA